MRGTTPSGNEPLVIAEPVSSVTQAIVGVSKSIKAASDSNYSPLEIALIAAAAGAIFAAIFSYAFTFIHWKLTANKEKVTSIGKGISEVTTLIESDALLYWLQDYSLATSNDLSALEIKMKANLKGINRDIILFCTGLPKDKRDQHSKDLKQAASDLYDLVTGGDFESTARIASKSQAALISSKCSTIRSKVLSLTFFL